MHKSMRTAHALARAMHDTHTHTIHDAHHYHARTNTPRAAEDQRPQHAALALAPAARIADVPLPHAPHAASERARARAAAAFGRRVSGHRHTRTKKDVHTYPQHAHAKRKDARAHTHMSDAHRLSPTASCGSLWLKQRTLKLEWRGQRQPTQRSQRLRVPWRRCSSPPLTGYKRLC